MSAGEGAVAPGDLELVRAFVNTRDIEGDLDQLRTPGEADGWAQVHDLQVPATTPGEMPGLVELREALRAILLAHHEDGAGEPAARAVVNAAMEQSRVRPVLEDDGLGWSATTSGTHVLVGLLLCRVAAATVDGTWLRLKVCANDVCQWAFYDHSRSRTGRWCSMQVCGNRNKQQRFRHQTASERGGG